VGSCLNDRWCAVRWMLARAVKEGRGLVLVLPHVAFEVLARWSVVGAHLCQLGHVFAGDGLKPLSGSEFHEGGSLPLLGKGSESPLGSEDLLVLVLQSVEEVVPVLKRHGLDLGDGSRA